VWIQGLGAWGAVVFSAVYVGVVVAMAPAEIMSIAAGFIFGAWGFPLVVTSATIGATLAFLVSRYIVREKVRTLARRRPLFQAIDRIVGEDGWKIVALLRLNPLVPFNFQNYFFGATDVGLVSYTVSTFFGTARRASYDKKVALVLQGGGALGSYQAGVYEALASSEYLPDWVAGISIGAINARSLLAMRLRTASRVCAASGRESLRLARRGLPA
jgi:hypothetical protein